MDISYFIKAAVTSAKIANIQFSRPESVIMASIILHDLSEWASGVHFFLGIVVTSLITAWVCHKVSSRQLMSETRKLCRSSRTRLKEFCTKQLAGGRQITDWSTRIRCSSRQFHLDGLISSWLRSGHLCWNAFFPTWLPKNWRNFFREKSRQTRRSFPGGILSKLRLNTSPSV